MRQFIPPSVFVLFLTIFYAQIAFGQMDSLLFSYQDAIENAVSANEDAAFDYDTEFEYLQDYIRKPLNVNRAKATDFQNLRLLTPEQIAAIINHREKYGNFITLLELQGVLPLPTIRKILPFVTIDSDLNGLQIPVNQWFRKGKNDVFTRYERRLEQAKGYKKEGNQGGFQGDANRLYARYRYAFGNYLSYGVTIEKDAGEPFRQSGFDFYSAHFQINNAHKLFKTIVLGDYAVSLGQGLIHENGFALGKSALVLSVEKAVPPLRFYSSSNEANFLRGVATTLQISKNTEGVFFASHRLRDGNILNPDSVDFADAEAVISALQFSGLHRTATERQDQNRIGLTTFGGSVQRRFRRFSMGLNAVFNQFDGEIKPAEKLYNLYTFRGKRLANFSTNYKTTRGNIHAFGETAISSNGGFATLNGLLIGLDKRLSISVLQRFFSINYQALNTQPFAESSRAQDENGLFIGLEFKPNRTWTANFYADFWQHKWLRFGVDAPSYGREFFAKIAYRSRNTEGYVQFRNKLKQENATRPDSAKVNVLANKIRTQIRFQVNNQISKNVELRNRLEWSIFDSDQPQSNGFAVWQDVIFKLDKYPLSISSRLAFFDTKDYNSAIYAFENDVQYSFTVLPYYYRGSRFYLNASYRLLKNAYLETRFAQTYLTNRTTFGSGLDEIEGNKRTDVKVQFRVSF
jgi:hypothetical protein